MEIRKMKNEKLSEVVKAVCACARLEVKTSDPNSQYVKNMLERIELLENKLVPILADLEAVEN